MAISKDVWVFVELEDQKLKATSVGLMEEGKRLSGQLGAELHAILFGPRLEGTDHMVGIHGADHLYYVHDESLRHYVPPVYERLLTGLVTEGKPALLLAAAGSLGSDLFPRVAGKLKIPLITHCVEIRVQERMEFIKPIQQGRLHAVLVGKRDGILMATLSQKVLTVSEEKKEPRAARLTEIRAKMEGQGVPIHVRGFVKADHRTIDLNEAEIIVAVGRGIGAGENFKLIQDLADRIEGAIGGTRPVVDAGILPFERQIGQTGKTVSPKLVVMCGVSGAIEFMKGIEGAGTKIAINTDRQAPVFKSVDLGILGDLKALIPRILTHMGRGSSQKKP